MIFSTITAMALAAQSTQTLPKTDVLAAIKQDMLELEGVAAVGIGLSSENGQDVTVWQLETSRNQPMIRFYQACRVIAQHGAMDPNIDVMFVSNIVEANKSTKAEDWSLGRFNCASWTYYSF